MPTNKFYPKISSIISVNEIPDQIGFLTEPLNNLFDNIYFRDLQFTKSESGDTAFYSIVLVSHKKLGVDFPGTGFAIVLNPSQIDPTNASEFPVSLSVVFVLVFTASAFLPASLYKAPLRSGLACTVP